jgi:hypothetical protein
VERVIALAGQYGRYGYRRITAMLQLEGWRVNHKRVERIWRQEGLKVPSKQPKRGRLWLTDGSCIRLRPTKRNHVWSYDMAMIRTTDGRALRILVIIDEFTRECLSMYVARRIRHHDVLIYRKFVFGLGTNPSRFSVIPTRGRPEMRVSPKRRPGQGLKKTKKITGNYQTLALR